MIFQEGVKGNLRISRSKKSRWRDKGTLGIVMAMWFWLVHTESGIRLRNSVVFTHTHTKDGV